MENNIERRRFLKLAGTAALSVAFGSFLGGCAKKEDNISAISIERCFHDENNEGIDDSFEQIVESSDEKIAEIAKIEAYVNFVKVCNDTFTDSVVKLSTKEDILDRLQKGEEYSLADIETLTEKMDRFQELSQDEAIKTASGEQEEYYHIARDLYRDFLITNDYLKRQSFDVLANFGLDLTKAILIDTAGFSGTIDNVTIPQRPSTSEPTLQEYSISYENDGYAAKLSVPSGSCVYDIVDNVYKCQNSHAGYNQGEFDGEYDNDAIELIQTTIDSYKAGTALSAEITEPSFLSHSDCLKSNSREEAGKALVAKL